METAAAENEARKRAMGLDGSSSDEDMPQRGPADSNDEDSPDEDFVAPKDASDDDDDDDDDDDEDGSGSDEEEEKPKKKKVRYTYMYRISRVPPPSQKKAKSPSPEKKKKKVLARRPLHVSHVVSAPPVVRHATPLAEEAQS